MQHFIGRSKQLTQLKERVSSRVASLVVVKGRRRIGKSRLTEEFGRTMKTAFYFSGLAPEKGMGATAQQEEFIRQLSEQRIPSTGSNDWGNLFFDLAQFCSKGQVLIVLDEISWMADADKTFLPKLKNTWDRHFKKNTQLILILSGSDSAWIERNILSKTGFFGRVSLRMKLEELALNECVQFWGKYREKVSSYEVLKLLAITGGVPRYLEEINPKLTAEENICKLCYQSEGILFNEFEDIFHDLFKNRSAHYQEIIRSIIAGAKTVDEIAVALKRNKGGDLTRVLSDLCKDGFLSRNYSWHFNTGNQSKINQFRVRDNYVRFYLKYIEPHKKMIENQSMDRLPRAWDSILGLQFENLVINHWKQLIKLLNILSSDIINCGPYLQTETKLRKKCQIDFLIQTKYNTLYLCEIKFRKNEINSSVIKEVEQKVERLITPKNFSIRTVLIHVNGVSDKVYEEDSFSNIIDFSDFLEE